MKLLLILLGVASCAGAPSAPTTHRERVESVKLLVQCPTDPAMKNTTIGGSGVIVSGRQVLTAAHVVPCKDAQIRAMQTETHRVTMMKVEVSFTGLDVARLVIDGDGEFFEARLAVIGSVGYGDQICVLIGFPRQDRRCGLVDNLDSGKIENSVNVEPGNSGSGVYDSSDRLIGIITNARRGRTGMPIGSVAESLIGREWVLK